MLSWAVSILILTILAIVVGYSDLPGRPVWMVRGILILILIICVAAAVLA